MGGDRIRVEGMIFFGPHGQPGAGAAAHALGGRFRVDVELERDLRRPGRTDALPDTVDYTHVYHVVKQVLEGPRRHLLEALAEDVARRLAESCPGLDAIRVRVRREDAPLAGGGALPAVAVEIERRPRIDYP